MRNIFVIPVLVSIITGIFQCCESTSKHGKEIAEDDPNHLTRAQSNCRGGD